MRAAAEASKFVLTFLAAVVIGFGVPAGWVWIGSQLQGPVGATTVSFSVAIIVLMGIIGSYALLGFLAGAFQAWLNSRHAPAGSDEEGAGSPRAPWMHGMTEQRRRPGDHELSATERLFVTTTLIVGFVFVVWFLLFAESPLPQ